MNGTIVSDHQNFGSRLPVGIVKGKKKNQNVVTNSSILTYFLNVLYFFALALPNMCRNFVKPLVATTDIAVS